MTTPIHLDTDELAARWRLTKQLLATWRHQGKGPRFIKLHRKKVLYPLDEIEKWERERMQRSTVG